MRPVDQSFLINGQGGRTSGVKINSEQIWLKNSQPAIVAGKLHLFGGYYPVQRQVSLFLFFFRIKYFQFQDRET